MNTDNKNEEVLITNRDGSKSNQTQAEDNSLLFDTKESAKKLKLCVKSIYRLVARGVLRRNCCTRKILISRQELEAFARKLDK